MVKIADFGKTYNDHDAVSDGDGHQHNHLYRDDEDDDENVDL